MSQCCGKSGTPEDTGNNKRSIEGMQSRFQGDIGESAVSEYVTEHLGHQPEFFDKRDHGFDMVFRDSMGKLVLIESKLTMASGLSALGHPAIGTEGSVPWVEYYAELMCDPLSSFYTPDNAKIGEEILRVGAENVTFLVVHIDPGTLETDVTKLR